MPSVASILHQRSAPQHRAITRQQALDAGLTVGEWRTAIRADLVERVFHNVYIVGEPLLTQRELIACTQLRLRGVVLAGLSGFEARRCMRERLGHLEIWTAGRAPTDPLVSEVPMRMLNRERRRRLHFGLIDVRSYEKNVPPRVERVNGLPVTTVSRGLVDLSARHPREILGKAWTELEFRTLLDAPAIRAELKLERAGSLEVQSILRDRYPVTRPGDDIRSPGESALLHLLRDGGLPRPTINALMRLPSGGEHRPDFWFQLFGVTVEYDPEHHDVKPRDRADKARSSTLQSHGIVVLQFARTHVERDPAWVLETIERTLRTAGWVPSLADAQSWDFG